jgi:hypothetical protein
MNRVRKALVLVLMTGVLGACVLPDFDKVDGAAAGKPDAAGGKQDAGSMPDPLPGKACGLSDQLPRACDACIRQKCCELATECGKGTECGKDMLEPITPAADFSEDFDPLLGCMQTRCEAACKVNLGCLDDYTWPDAEGTSDIEILVADYADAVNLPLADVTVKACAALDPLCVTGVKAEGVTGADGRVMLKGIPAAFDGFYSFDGADYAPSTAHWTEPVHRASGFTQYQLSPTELGALAIITGIHKSIDEPFDPGLGHLIFRVQGCLPMRYVANDVPPSAGVAGVRVEFSPNDGASQTFYLEENGSVSVTLTKTTAQGLGGAFNLLPRNVTVKAIDVATDREVARGTVNVRAGTIGFAWMVARSKR